MPDNFNSSKGGPLGVKGLNWHNHMKDHVEIGHLTKYDAFRVNRPWNITIQNPYKHLYFGESVPQNHILFKLFISFVTTVTVKKNF